MCVKYIVRDYEPAVSVIFFVGSKDYSEGSS